MFTSVGLVHEALHLSSQNIVVFFFFHPANLISEILEHFNLMSPEDISDDFGMSHHSRNLKFEHFGESYLKLMSPGLT